MESSELEAIGEGIAKLEKQDAIDPTIAAALKVMLLTGARCSEILILKWEYFNESKEKALLPNSKRVQRFFPFLPPHGRLSPLYLALTSTASRKVGKRPYY